MIPEIDIFKRLIQLLEANNFWTDIFEKQSLFVSNTGIDINFNIEKFEELLWSQEQYPERKVDVNLKGNSLVYKKKEAGKDRFRWLMDRYQEGGTIIFNGIDEIDKQLAEMARSLDVIFRGRTSVNAFLTPPNSSGFLPHFDTHDVFILQTGGEKHWQLYEKQLELPLDRQIYLVDQETIGKPITAHHLKQNDLLYIPRGLIHGAFTEDAYSLHLTVGVRPLLKVEYLKTMLDAIAEEDEEFRKSMLDDGQTQLPELVRKIEEYIDNAYFKKRTDTILNIDNQSKTKPTPGHHIANIHKVGELRINSLLKKAYPGKGFIEYHLDKIRLYYPGVGFSVNDEVQQGSIEYDSIHYGAINFIISQESSFIVKDIPDIYPDETKLKLVEKLIREGFLKFV